MDIIPHRDYLALLKRSVKISYGALGDGMEKKRMTFKEIVIWCFQKPIIKIYFVPDEEKLFKEHANKFLHPDAIKPEHRNKEEK